MRFLVLVAALGLTACTPDLDPHIKSGIDALDEAYVIDVKPADAAFTNCSWRNIDSRYVARCGISYGSTQLAQIGLWEVERKGDKFAVYAMNGKALSALERITAAGSHSMRNAPNAFQSGTGRTPLDTAKVEAAFN